MGVEMPVPLMAQRPKLPLVDFLITKLHSEGPLTKEALREQAELAGYFAAGDAAPGRTLHLTLTNLATAGRIEKLEDGRFDFAARPIMAGPGPEEDNVFN
jgi:hypothetical protein